MKVSIVMPIYNNSQYLNEAITGILQSNYTEFELIIIDDCSTDSSVSIARKCINKENRCQFIELSKNVGAAQALKAGIKASQGEFIIFASGDDISLPNRVQEIVSTFENNLNVGVVVSNAYVINTNSDDTKQKVEFPDYLTNQNIALYQFKRNHCLGATMAIRRDVSILSKSNVLIDIDDYQISIEYLLAGYDIFLLNKNLIKYRIHENNISNNRILLMEKLCKCLSFYENEDIHMELDRRGFSKNDIYLSIGIFNLFRDNISTGFNYLKKINNKYIKSQSFSFEYYFYLSIYFYKNNNLGEALKGLEKSSNSYLNHPTVFNNMGVIYCGLGSNDKAEQCFRKSIEQAPNYLDANFNLNEIQKRLNDNVFEKLKFTDRLLEEKLFKRANYLV